MSFLYGDSSTSPLQTNFIEFLRRALDFSVQVLLADERLRKGRERRHARERAAHLEIERLEALGGSVARLLEAAPAAPAESPSARCAAAIDRATLDAVRNEISGVRAVLASDIATIDGEAARERGACVRALEALLLRHDLPNSETVLHVVAQGATQYAARLSAKTDFGLESVLELVIPVSDLFAHDVRVDRVLEGLEVHAPESGGFFRKGMRMVPHKLGKHHVTELRVTADLTTVKLRAAHDNAAPGFDVAVGDTVPRVRLARVGKDGGVPETIDEVSDADAARLVELTEKLRAATADLPGSRKALLEARAGGCALAEDEHPAKLVERLIAAMAPVVQEISKRSLTQTELVLKRLLADDRREEIFVSKAELRAKLDALGDGQRELFEPLGLIEEEPPTQVDPRSSKKVIVAPMPEVGAHVGAAGSGTAVAADAAAADAALAELIEDVDVDEAWEEPPSVPDKRT